MASRRDLEEYADANRNIRALALRELNGFWATLSKTDPMSVRRALEEFLPLLVREYGEIAATVAADYFDRLRDQSGARGTFTAVLADEVDPEVVRANARWGIGPLFATAADPDGALARLEQVVDRMTLAPGRNTFARSVRNDPAKPRWARVPSGRTCAFCLMLASRGPVYLTEESAGGTGNDFHANDDCTPTALWPDDPFPEGYDPDVLYGQYEDARRAAESGATRRILSALREQQGIN